jgi:drug/metabolite transporter (DMT)-like permease
MTLGHTVINYILANYPASLVTMIALGEPFGAGLLAYLVLGQSIELAHLFYGSVIVTVVFVTLTATSRRIGEGSQ